MMRESAELTSPEMPEASCLYTEAQVSAGLDRLAADLQPLVDSDDCVLLGVLAGGLYPLIRLGDRLQGDFISEFCHASRYQGGKHGGELEWFREPAPVIRDKTVIIIDDIWDEGITLAAVARRCREGKARDVRTAVLVIKDRPRAAGIAPPDFDAGLVVPDVYVFGCGMDLEGRWRHLPAIYALGESGAA
jgi:hypoxanthine phosphoribosyltransferase